MKCVPDVKIEGISESLSLRHFALSLVGEPIMYPETNLLIDELCRRQIPTLFMESAHFSEKD